MTFLHYFSGSVKFGLGEAISAAAARRGIKVRVINRDILRDGTDLLADEPFSSDFTAALNGHFDGFHSGFPCSSARFLPGGPPPVRNRALAWVSIEQSSAAARSGERNIVGNTVCGHGSCCPVREKEAEIALHSDARESSGSWCRPIPECLVVARISQHHLRTRRRASNSQHLLFWSSSLEGAMLGWFSSRSRNIRKEVLLQGSAGDPLPKQPLEPRRRTHHSSA